MLKIMIACGNRTLVKNYGDYNRLLSYIKNPINPQYNDKINVTPEEFERHEKLLKQNNYIDEIIDTLVKQFTEITSDGTVLQGGYNERPKAVGKLDGKKCPNCKCRTFKGYEDTGQGEFNFRECTHCDWTVRI